MRELVEGVEVFRGFRRMRLIAEMIWRRWVPSAGEELARAERMAARAELGQQQRLAAAAFRWRLVQQRSGRSAGRQSGA